MRRGGTCDSRSADDDGKEEEEEEEEEADDDDDGAVLFIALESDKVGGDERDSGAIWFDVNSPSGSSDRRAGFGLSSSSTSGINRCSCSCCCC